MLLWPLPMAVPSDEQMPFVPLLFSRLLSSHHSPLAVITYNLRERQMMLHWQVTLLSVLHRCGLSYSASITTWEGLVYN